MNSEAGACFHSSRPAAKSCVSSTSASEGPGSGPRSSDANHQHARAPRHQSTGGRWCIAAPGISSVRWAAAVGNGVAETRTARALYPPWGTGAPRPRSSGKDRISKLVVSRRGAPAVEMGLRRCFSNCANEVRSTASILRSCLLLKTRTHFAHTSRPNSNIPNTSR